MAVIVSASVCGANGEGDAAKAPIEIISPLLPREADANGDTLLIRMCRLASTMAPEQRRHLQPIIGLLLESGANPLFENLSGCNAMFYINGMPELMKDLAANYYLPRELTLRLPHERAAFLRYMRLRVAQERHTFSEGSKAYLLRRYCKPAYQRTEKLFQELFRQESPRRIPEGALGDCLDFMRLAEPEKTYSYINELNYWDHAEHFLEEMPGLLLRELHRLSWPVNPGKLRLALKKLHTMLPTSQDDMIDCNAAGPMIQLLDLLVAQEGERVQQEVKNCAASHDPDLAQAALRLLMRMQGLTPPDEIEDVNGAVSSGLQSIRSALMADSALRHCEAEVLTPDILQQAAECCQQHGMPARAEIFNQLRDGKKLSLSPAALPAISTAYNEIREKSLSVVLLRYLLTHPQLLAPTAQP